MSTTKITIYIMMTLSFFISQSIKADNEIVIVDGVGSSEGAAVNDGERRAVEEVAGVYLKSKSLIDKFSLIKDEIEVIAKGCVVRHEKLKTVRIQNGGYKVSLKVWVKKESLEIEIDEIVSMFTETNTIYAVLDDPFRYHTDVKNVEANAMNDCRKKVVDKIRGYLFDKGLNFVNMEAVARNMEDLKIIGSLSSLDGSAEKLYKAESSYTMVLTLTVAEIPAGAPGFTQYWFTATLNGFLSQTGTKLNDISISDTNFRVQVPKSEKVNIGSMQFYFWSEGEKLADELSPKCFLQLKKQILAFKNHQIYFINFRGYDLQKMEDIRQGLISIPNFNLEEWESSSVGVEKVAMARGRYSWKGKNKGGELMGKILEMLKERNLFPVHGAFCKGRQIVFTK